MSFKPVWEAMEVYIGTELSGTPAAWTYAKLCVGIEGLTPNFNETNVQNWFMCGEGFAHNTVTGAAPEIAVTGKRAPGDTAQDYIAGLQWVVGSARESSVKIIAFGKQIVAPCVIGDINVMGGNATDLNNFSCTIRMNGKPTVTDVQA